MPSLPDVPQEASHCPLSAASHDTGFVQSTHKDSVDKESLQRKKLKLETNLLEIQTEYHAKKLQRQTKMMKRDPPPLAVSFKNIDIFT